MIKSAVGVTRYALFFLLAGLVLTSISCMAVSQIFFVTPATPAFRQFTLSPTPSAVPATPSAATIACPDGDCITACVAQLSAITQSGAASPGGSKSVRRDFGGEEGYVLASYNISGDQIQNLDTSIAIPKNLKVYQEDISSQKRIWNYFAAIIPLEQRSFLDQYDVFTDGRDNILASVSQSETDMGRWVLTVDIMDAANPQDLTYTLLHEFGHLLTLNPSQVKPSVRVFNNPNSEKVYQQEADACTTYFPDDGCSAPDSYINKFFERFWVDIYAEWYKIDSIQEQSRYEAALEKFYNKHKDQFVTDYAPTDPAEDIAETFSFFIIQPNPTGDSIADQKVNFLYNFPELVQLRSQIGQRLCGQIEKK